MNKIVVKFNKEEDDYWNFWDQVEVVDVISVDKLRWYTIYTKVITHPNYPDKFFRTDVEEDNTEYQETDRPDAIELIEVEPYEKVIIAYPYEKVIIAYPYEKVIIAYREVK